LYFRYHLIIFYINFVFKLNFYIKIKYDEYTFISGKKAFKISGVAKHILYKYEKEGLIKTIRSSRRKRFYNVYEYLKITI